MAKSFLAGFLSGAAKVGGDMAQKENDLQMEADAYVAKYKRQKQIDLESQSQLDDVELKKQQQAAGLIWDRLRGGMSASGQTQTDSLFAQPASDDSLSNEPTDNADGTQDDAVATPDPLALSEEDDTIDSSEAGLSVTPMAPSAGAGSFVITPDQFKAEFAKLPADMRNPKNADLATALIQTRLKNSSNNQRYVDAKTEKTLLEVEQLKEDRTPGGGLDKKLVLDTLREKDLPANPKILAGAASTMTRKDYNDALKEQLNQLNSDSHRKDVTQAVNAADIVQNAYDLAKQTHTGPLSGSNIAVLFNNLTGNPELAAFNSSSAGQLASAPRNPGSVSDFETKGLQKATTQSTNSREANIQVAANMLNHAVRVKEAYEYEQSLGSSALIDWGQAGKEYRKYADANPRFVMSGGVLVENTARVSMEEWDWERGTPKEGVVSTKVDSALDKHFAVTPQEDKLLETFKN